MYKSDLCTFQVKYKEVVDWSEPGLKTEDTEAWTEYDEPADLTTHQVTDHISHIIKESEEKLISTIRFDFWSTGTC